MLPFPSSLSSSKLLKNTKLGGEYSILVAVTITLLNMHLKVNKRQDNVEMYIYYDAGIIVVSLKSAHDVNCNTFLHFKM